MRMGNPSVKRWVTKSGDGKLAVEVSPATYKGVYGKTALFTLITIIAAVASELLMLSFIKNGNYEGLVFAGIATTVCMVPLIIISFIIMFVPSSVKVLGFIYAVLQGGLLGSVGLFVDIFYPGLAFAAFLGTSIVFLISVAVNKLMEVRISSKFARGLIIAGMSLVLVELVMWMLSAFGVFSFDNTVLIWIQLGISAFCIVWATIMLSWDLQNIDVLVKNGADKRYEWNLAFSLTTTLIYLYIEILEFLLRLVILFGRKSN